MKGRPNKALHLPLFRHAPKRQVSLVVRATMEREIQA